MKFNSVFADSDRLPNTCNVSFTGKGLYGRYMEQVLHMGEYCTIHVEYIVGVYAGRSVWFCFV